MSLFLCMVREKEIESILNYIGKSSVDAADVVGLCLCLWYSIMFCVCSICVHCIFGKV
jgi:hypothetical protein